MYYFQAFAIIIDQNFCPGQSQVVQQKRQLKLPS